MHKERRKGEKARRRYWFMNWPPYTEDKEKMKTEAGYSRLVGGGFNKQGNEFTRLVLGSGRTSRSPHLPTRVFKVYRETLMGFSHLFSPDGLSNTLPSQGFILDSDYHCGNGGQNMNFKDKGGGKSL